MIYIASRGKDFIFYRVIILAIYSIDLNVITVNASLYRT